MDIELSRRDIMLALSIAGIGAFFNSARFLLYMNTLNAFEGFLIYYAILYGTLFALSKMDLIIFKPNVSDLQGSIGILLLTFSFFLCVNWTNPFVQYVTTGSFQGASNVFTNNSEDGLTWAIVTQVFGITNIGTAWLLTFVVTPFLLSILGLALVGGKVSIDV